MDSQNKELRFSDAGENLIGKKFQVLDKGFISLVSYHGTDALIEAAARVSYQEGTRKTSDTENLIRFLIRNKHLSPTEMPCCIFHLKMPLYVIQQLLRHRTAKLNQESHRYSEVSSDKQLTDPSDWRTQSKNNKQGSSGFVTEYPEEFQNIHIDQKVPSNTYEWTGGYSAGEYLSREEDFIHDRQNKLYEQRLEFGVAKEQARKDIPHSTYSQLYWQMDLRNLLHFMSLRCDSHAQLEIRVYANKIAGMVKELFPITFGAWYDFHFNSAAFSLLDRQFLAHILKQSNYTNGFDKLKEVYHEQLEEHAMSLGMGKREIAEFWDKISVPTEQDFSL